MAGMSERPPDARPEETLWVVDVTAPLPPGRVRLVAAEAAARLNLRAEKLVALLENRIGPVTKPLPKASADRVAEVLDLAGADVAIRSAEPQEASEAARDAAREAAAPPREPAEPPATAGAGAVGGDPAEPGEAAAAEAAEAAAGVAADGGPSEAHGAAPGPDDVPLGRAGREPSVRTLGRDGPPPVADAGRPGAGPTEPASRERAEAWPDDLTERAEDDAMLGAWRRRTPAPPLDAEPQPAWHDAPEPSDLQARAARGQGPPGAAPGGLAGAAASAGVGRSEDPGALGAYDEDEDEEDAWAFGLRDPFAEAERRERAVRRWALVIALLVAVAVFVTLQWAYSVPGPEGSAPPAYEAGLRHYRDGAFVSAARAWAPRAEAGDAQAMFMLGWMAEYGQGRAWSNRDAAGWYRQAAERGHVGAAARLAGLYGRGLGVARDDGEALRWYLQAAEGGDAAAQREAARRLATAGRLGEARSWLRRAATADPDAAAWQALLDASD
jgi:hypothetical protein